MGVCLTPHARAAALIIDGPDDPPDPSTSVECPRSVPTGGHPAGSDRQWRPGGTPPGARTELIRDFVRQVVRSHPGRRLHIVVDTAVARSLIRASDVAECTAGVPVHFSLSTRMWLNLVDVWCQMMITHSAGGDDHDALRIRELIGAGRPALWIRQAEEAAEATGGMTGLSESRTLRV
jgi:hypothetical protein